MPSQIPDSSSQKLEEMARAIEAEEAVDYETLKVINREKAVELKTTWETTEQLLLSKLNDLKKSEKEFHGDILTQLDEGAADRIFSEIPEFRDAFENINNRYEDLFEVMYILSTLLEETVEFVEEMSDDATPKAGAEDDIDDELLERPDNEE